MNETMSPTRFIKTQLEKVEKRLCTGRVSIKYKLGYADTAFLVTIVSETIFPVPNPITFNETRINLDGHYDNTTGIYTVPLDGIYDFYVHVYSYPDVDYIVKLYVDGFDSILTRGSDYGSQSGYVSANVQVT